MMRPAAAPNNPTLLTKDDLTALDVIGWNIDYEGKQPTVLDPYNPFDFNSNLIPQADFEKANGIIFKPGFKLLVE